MEGKTSSMTMSFASLRRRLFARAPKPALDRHPETAKRWVADSSRPNVLLLGKMAPSVEQQLGEPFHVHRALNTAERDDCIREVGTAIRAIATGNSHPIDASLVARLPALEIVSVVGVGYENVDVAACTARGIVVSNTPGASVEEVADTAIGLLLMTVRELSAAERWLRAGEWGTRGAFPLTRGTLRNRRLGILGLGRVGRAVARRAEAFGLSIAYHGPRKKPDVAYPYHAELVGMARSVDTLIVCAPGGHATSRIVNAEVLSALGPDGVLVNVSRGSCVDEDALIAALKAGRILGAGLDVYQDEPRPRQELLGLERTVLLPHVGTASRPTREAMGQLLVDNLKSWFQSGKALTPVNERVAGSPDAGSA